MIDRARLERRARMMRRINVPVRAILDLPFTTPLSSRLMLVEYTGRRTGRHYRQPVSYVRDGDTLLTPGGGAWKANLGEGGRQPTHGTRYSPWAGKMCWWISRTWRMAYSSAHWRVSGGSSMGASQSRRLLSP